MDSRVKPSPVTGKFNCVGQTGSVRETFNDTPKRQRETYDTRWDPSPRVRAAFCDALQAQRHFRSLTTRFASWLSLLNRHSTRRQLREHYARKADMESKLLSALRRHAEQSWTSKVVWQSRAAPPVLRSAEHDGQLPKRTDSDYTGPASGMYFAGRTRPPQSSNP